MVKAASTPASAGSPNAYTVRVAAEPPAVSSRTQAASSWPVALLYRPWRAVRAGEVGAEPGGGLVCPGRAHPGGPSVKSGRTQISGANSSRQVPSRQSTARATASAQGSRARPGQPGDRSPGLRRLRRGWLAALRPATVLHRRYGAQLLVCIPIAGPSGHAT